MSWFSFGDWWSFWVSPPLAELIYCTGQFATGSNHRRKGRRNEETEISFSHPPPLFSHTVNTERTRLPVAAGGSTAPLQWAGRRGNCSGLFTNSWSSPGSTAAVRWDLHRRSDWSLTEQSAGFHFKQTQQPLILLILCLICIDQELQPGCTGNLSLHIPVITKYLTDTVKCIVGWLPLVMGRLIQKNYSWEPKKNPHC